ncbi:MAG: ATP-binding protein [Patescibacteria group bacterium]|nr:ATP-binding protein [Patescibacteria group bacterium]
MIKREIFKKIKPWFGDEKILIIKGARQTGKTTLLLYIKKYLENNNNKVVYFSVDQDLDNPIFKDSKLFLKYINNQYGLKNKKLYILLDEFQYIKNAGLFLKNIFDKEKKRLQLIVSGSSSLEITKNSEFLTGRKIDFFMQTLSFQEFLSEKSENKYDYSWNFNNNIKELADFYKIYKQDLEINFLDYINWGGYPEVTIVKNRDKRKAILNDIVKTYIKKDVASFLRVQNISGYNNLILLLSNQIGNLVNKNELSDTLKLNTRTIENYLDILEGTFVFQRLIPFFSNLRKTLTKMPKIYCRDFGIIKSAVGHSEILDYNLISGEMVENFIFKELSGIFLNEDIFFYRTISGAEIDFIIKRDFLYSIEVKFRKNIKTMPVAMKHFADDYKEKVKLNIVFTKDFIGFDKKSDCFFIPVVLMPFVKDFE